jgi:uroporphyrinogen decarboxylase
MNSRERVLQSINHKQPDKLPLDLGSTPSSGISAIGYNKLKKELGLKDGFTRVYDVVQQVAHPEWKIIELLGVDVIDIGRAYNTKSTDWYDVKLSDGSIAQYPKWFKPEPNNKGGYDVFQDGDLKME